MTATTGTVPPPPNGATPTPLPAQPIAPTEPTTAGLPTPPRRQPNVVWILGGIGLMVLAAISAISIGRSLAARHDVLVTSRPFLVGDIARPGDFQVASIALDDPLPTLTPEQATELVGMVATGPLPAGAILTESSFVPATAVDGETVIFGAALDPGEYPRRGLQAGDQVMMVEVSLFEGGDESLPAVALEIGKAEVVEVVPITTSARLLVSMRIPAELTVTASQVAEDERLRLVLIESADSSNQVRPQAPIEPINPLDDGDEEGDDASSTDASGASATTGGDNQIGDTSGDNGDSGDSRGAAGGSSAGGDG